MPPKTALKQGRAGAHPATVGMAESDSEFHVAVATVRFDPEQPRRNVDHGAIKSLAQSLQAYGQLESILVEPIGADGTHNLVAGECRVRAAQELGWATLRARTTRLPREIIQLVENEQRRGLNPAEKAYGLERMIEAHGFTQAEAAGVIGVSEPEASRLLKVRRLPEPMLHALERGDVQVSGRVLRELTALLDSGEDEALKQAWRYIETASEPTGQSVRAVIDRARGAESSERAEPAPRRGPRTPDAARQAATRARKTVRQLAQAPSEIRQAARPYLQQLRDECDAALQDEPEAEDTSTGAKANGA